MLKAKHFLVHRPMKMRHRKDLIVFANLKTCIIALANLLPVYQAIEREEDRQNLAHPQAVSNYNKYVKTLLDFLEHEDGQQLWGMDEYILKKLWSLVKDVVSATMGPHIMHVDMRPKDVGQRMLWTLLWFAAAELYAGRPHAW